MLARRWAPTLGPPQAIRLRPDLVSRHGWSTIPSGTEAVYKIYAENFKDE
jgi:hypothetical protein